ncbi:helix-turn-helix domain-containing protein [Kitasatospora arboriphila]
MLDRAGRPQPGRGPAHGAPPSRAVGRDLLLTAQRDAGAARRAVRGQRPRSLTEIADLLGFSAPSAFSRWFREQFGCTAREWRERRGQTAEH